MPITHVLNSGVADGSTTAEVRPSNWNADHQGSISASTASIPEVLTRVFSITSSNTSAISTLVNYSVPARTLGINRMLRFTAVGDVLVGTTAVLNGAVFTVSHAGSSRFVDTLTTVAAAQTIRGSWRLQTIVAAVNSSGTRFLNGQICQSSGGTAATFGIGDLSQNAAGGLLNISQFASSGTFTITTGVAEAFVVQRNWSAANSSLSFVMQYGVLELI